MRGEEGEVVWLAVRPSILLKEVATAQLCLTLSAHKVLGVPDLPQGCHHLRNKSQKLIKCKNDSKEPLKKSYVSICRYLSYYWLLTGRTVSLGGCLNSLSAQIWLEESQHAVKWATRWRLWGGGGLLRCRHHWSDRCSWLGKKHYAWYIRFWDFNSPRVIISLQLV